MSKKKLTLEQIRQKEAGLSPRARQVWVRMQQGGFWSHECDPDAPKCLPELIASGLVVRIVRAKSLRATLAPVGSKSMKQDTIADYREVR